MRFENNELVRILRQNRIGFISIQNSHTIPAVGYHAPYVRTGYEAVIAQRVGAMFAYCAKDKGKVVKVSEKGVIIEYKDGKKVGLKIGREFGRAEGSVFPFDILSNVKEGQSFDKGDPIIYNSQYFQHDPWNPKQLVMKNSLTARVMLCETKETHEDASAISETLSKRMGTTSTYVRSFIVTFEQNVHNTVKQGSAVEPQTILMSVEDEITSNLGSFGDEAAETLKGLSKQSPRANYNGIIDRIEVFYHGEKEDMNPSLLKLTEVSDTFIREQASATNKPKFTGQVTGDYRVEGTSLGLNKAELRFYITVGQNMGIAD